MATLTTPAYRRGFSTFEAAQICGVFHTTIISWVNKGLLEARRTPGKHRRIDLDVLLSFMRKHDIPIPAELKPKRIVLILAEDSALRCKLSKNLRPLPQIEVRVAGPEGFCEIGRASPALLLLQIDGRRVDGIEALRAVGRTITDDLKTVAVSKAPLDAAIDRKARLLSHGMIRHPFSGDDTRQAVSRALGITLN